MAVAEKHTSSALSDRVERKTEGSETRIVLLEAAAACLTRHGYAGVTTRRVAEEAGVPLSQIGAMKASWGTSTAPICFMRFLPSFCFSSSLRLRVMSPPRPEVTSATQEIC